MKLNLWVLILKMPLFLTKVYIFNIPKKHKRFKKHHKEKKNFFSELDENKNIP